MAHTRSLAVLAFCGIQALSAQSTQGLISGRAVNSVNGRPVAVATVEYASPGNSARGTAQVDSSGYYFLPQLSPGLYKVSVKAPGYQSQEVQELELPVAARLELDFRLRPLSDVWEAGQYKSVFLPGYKTVVTFFGPDVDTSRSGSFDANKGKLGALESTISAVIDSNTLTYLPLSGRDVYTLLVTQPGVTSDGGTARGLGLSIIGQRPSASNFLLDGLENNNYLITGPLTRVAPEAIQEYRVSTNNFSAEYGRTSGFLANAITRAGTNRFHGTGYFYLRNDILNANGFQENLRGFDRMPFRERQPGFVIGGPVWRERLFFSSSFENFHSRSQLTPQPYKVPAARFTELFTQEGFKSRTLLQQYPAPFFAGFVTGIVNLSQPVTVNRKIAIERLDYAAPSGKDRLMGRVMIARLERPDFIWTPYSDFISVLHQDTNSLAVTQAHTFRPGLINDARFGFSWDDLNWNRPHPEIPTFRTGDGVTLPGSPAFYEYRNANRSYELLDNIQWIRGPHIIVAGAGLLIRDSQGHLTAGRDGELSFSNVANFGQQRPSGFRVGVQRTLLPGLGIPDSNRVFNYKQYFGFIQDTWRMKPRLTVNYGLRYELFGGPSNTGAVKDAVLNLGSGSTLTAQIAGAQKLKLPGTGNQRLFGTDKTNFAGRAGASYDVSGKGRTILRAAYGLFYDRPYDNLWQNLRNNDFILPSISIPSPASGAPAFDLLANPAKLLATLAANRILDGSFPGLTVVDPNLRNGYAHSYFAGVQHLVTNSVNVEVNAQGSLGRSLITTDLVNRSFSADTLTGRFNNDLPDLSYRSNQGTSNYNAMTALARYRASRGTLQATYTWSHVIDNQSDALQGDFFNLTFTSLSDNGGRSGRAAFPLQFNPNSSRGNSDFDQRHNLVIFSYWNLPAPFTSHRVARWLFKNWTASQLAAFRSGFAYDLVGTSTVEGNNGLIWNNRPDVVSASNVFVSQPIPVTGGVRLLNAGAFTNARPSTLGNLGRNALRGPGLYNIDLSVSRSFPVRWFGEAGRFNVRADAYNVLNHANLNNPDGLVGSPTFGVASFGRIGRQSGFPATSPLNETGRQIQLSIRVEF